MVPSFLLWWQTLEEGGGDGRLGLRRWKRGSIYFAELVGKAWIFAKEKAKFL
jgi:hypothetical protein